MKKSLAIIMCLALMLTSMVFVSAEADAIITIGTVEGPIKAGEEVAVPITITEWANAYGTIEFELSFDKTLLKIDGIEASETDFSGAMGAGDDKRFALICNPSSKKQAAKVSGGEVAVAYFIAVTDIDVDTTIEFASIKVMGYAEGEKDGWVATNALNVGAVNGGIEIGPQPSSNTGSAIVSDASGKKGDQVTVTVSLGENTAIGCYKAKLIYDETALELVDMVKGDFCAFVNVNKKLANGFASSLTNVTSGTLFTAVFRVLVNNGDFEVNVEFDPHATAKTDATPVNMIVTPGVITVECSEHQFGNIKYDETDHWVECEIIGCGNVVNKAPHEGGEATCNAKAVCSVCGQSYGELNVNNHQGETEIRNDIAADCGNEGYTGDTYCLGCNTKIADGEAIPATGNHIGGIATCHTKKICAVCNAQYGEFDADNHDGETEIRNKTETYTGDTYCLGCNTKIADGKVVDPIEPDDHNVTVTIATVDGPIKAGEEVKIPITITEWANAYATIELELAFDESLLTCDGIEASEDDFKGSMGAGNGKRFALDCNPNSESQAAKVSGGEICVAYFIAKADINVSTVVEFTSIKVKGYTNGKADSWTAMKDLNVDVVNGGVKVSEDNTHTCTPSGDIKYDETDHWYVCENAGCGNVVNKAPHEGGEATCNAKAVCSVCNAEYGKLDADNHKKTKRQGVKEATCGAEGYTGDLVCVDCNEVIEFGNNIPSTGDHTYDDDCDEVCNVCGFVRKIEQDHTVKVKETITIEITITKEITFGLSDDTKAEIIEVVIETVIVNGEEQQIATVTIEGAKPGYVLVYMYDQNQEIVGQQMVYIEETEHSFVLAEVIKEATCAEEGKALYKCEYCGHEEERIVPVIDEHKNTEIRNASDTYTGDIYCLDCGKLVSKGENIGVLGDVDGNKIVNTLDAMLVAQYYVKLPLANFDDTVADVDGNGVINTLDAMLIAQYYVKLIPQFPGQNK